MEKIEKLKDIIYKLAKEKELKEQEKEMIEKIIEDKDYEDKIE